ncbi:hypothetical protein MHH85_13245 [Viridibacillus sp. FSL E2-0187]|nr:MULTISPECIES: hypothetical protein [unclassified Viridibacillus]OMC79210.1 hypothetical protein BK130_18660 [Viridibacillus sp. FSL H8-0123]OMC81540.1 hypothetical protein BK128_22025 [Viridibacillus sp. FSL H7-0596]
MKWKQFIFLSTLNVLLVLLVRAIDQSKWRIGNKWVKQNARGYEGQAEVLTSLVLECSTLTPSKFVVYYPCIIQLADGEQFDGCYSLDFRGTKQEVTIERLFEANFSSTDSITSNKTCFRCTYSK